MAQPISNDPLRSEELVLRGGFRRRCVARKFVAAASYPADRLGEREYAMLTGPEQALGFGRVENYEAPNWS